MLSPYKSPVVRAWFWTHRGLCALVLLFLILPVLVIIPLSFNSGSFLVYPLQGFSLRWFAAALTYQRFIDGLVLSLIVAVVSTTLGLLLGVPAALALFRSRWRGRAIVQNLFFSPLIIPELVLGMAYYRVRDWL